MLTETCPESMLTIWTVFQILVAMEISGFIWVLLVIGFYYLSKIWLYMDSHVALGSDRYVWQLGTAMEFQYFALI